MKTHYAKLFFDLEKAKQYGNEVDKISGEVSVQTGQRTYYRILAVPKGLKEEDYEVIGRFYTITRVSDPEERAAYHVQYSTASRVRQLAKKADWLDAQRRLESYLDQKYQELGPDLGRSLG